MLNVKIGSETIELATSLRIVYELGKLTGADSLQKAIASIGNLDMNGQIQLMYAAYAAANKDKRMSKEEFTSLILDNLGVYALTGIVNSLAEGLLYSGLSPEEVEAKKMEAAKAAEARTATPGATSSVAGIN